MFTLSMFQILNHIQSKPLQRVLRPHGTLYDHKAEMFDVHPMFSYSFSPIKSPSYQMFDDVHWFWSLKTPICLRGLGIRHALQISSWQAARNWKYWLKENIVLGTVRRNLFVWCAWLHACSSWRCQWTWCCKTELMAIEWPQNGTTGQTHGFTVWGFHWPPLV